MLTWFGEEWNALKAKVYEHIDIVPTQFEGNVKEIIDQIESMCDHYRDARDFLLDKIKDRSGTVIDQQITKIYF
ncbi:hypothetical protein G9A89_002965 [Geosiphon pyriformis]|nr:hypothetical protein G9A89_002965 [Geosiphon pyriformis]